MRKLTILFLLFFLNGVTRSQNIYSALQLNAEREYKTRKPTEIVETNTFFSSNGKRVEKNIKSFDKAGMLLSENQYDNGTLKARLTYTTDTVHRINLSRVFERWTQFGYSKETALYSYDKNFFLIGTTDKDANGNIIRQTNLVCNEKGHPIELSLFDANANSFGKEIATYLYDKNKVVTSVVTNDGSVLTRDTVKISFTEASKFPGGNEIYNANGDLTNWTSRNLNGSETIFEEEYTYDVFGNCTENKIFKVTVKGNGKRKRENDRIFTKEYFY
ncbi:MAG: hypothetical protein JWQ27_60 [Ferruginibacter sp.]|nr:hypothetical protein [Ferruginibacter sp.]